MLRLNKLVESILKVSENGGSTPPISKCPVSLLTMLKFTESTNRYTNKQKSIQ